MSRISGVSKSTMVEESKTEVKKPESVRKYPELGPFKRHTDIPETTSVYVRKPDFNQPQSQPKPQQQPVMISKKKEPEIGKGDGEEVVYCVLCFANPVEMLLPCYVNIIWSASAVIYFVSMGIVSNARLIGIK